jgi:glutathione S-transferase kappa 1
LKNSKTKEIKELLIQVTTEAVDVFGGFGAPYIVVEEEGKETQCFWGSDRFEALAFYLGKPWYGPNLQTKPKL